METGSVAEIYIPNFVNTLAQADQAAAFAKDQQRQNALASFMSQNGDALMQGDTNALAQFARLDPMAAMQIQQRQQDQQWRADDRAYSRQQDAIANQRADRQFASTEARQAKQDSRADEEWRMKLDAYAATKSQQEREAEAAQIEQAVQQGLALPDAATWDQFMTRTGQQHLVGKFDQREQIARGYLSIADQLKGQQPTQIWRPATAQESGSYGAQAGQINTQTGEFKRTPVDSGLSIETGPDGQMRVTQGAGASQAAGKPFTEGQSKDITYATRAEGALRTLDPIAGALASRRDRVLDSVPMGLGRSAQPDNYQVAKNAGDEFLQAILRKDTGAAITSDEQALYGTTYLPQPGDSEAVLGQKAQARTRALEALKAGMPPSAIVAQERALQSSNSDAAQPAQPKRRRWTPDGGLQ